MSYPQQPVPLRQEIDAWSDNPENKRQVDLFLLALHQFQNIDPREQYSYFQIAGIHGSPIVPWGECLPPQTPNEGYCNHNSTLFTTWHRPYLTLYEERIRGLMKEIAKEYPNPKEYEEAAETWRLPYWDWAELKQRDDVPYPIYDVPLLVQPPTISVNGPHGAVKLDPNPLARFVVPDDLSFGELGVFGWIYKGEEYPFNICHSTGRYLPPYDPSDPVVNTKWKHGYVDDIAVRNALNTHPDPSTKISLRDWVYRIIHNLTFDKFTTTLLNVDGQPIRGNTMSLEGVHNSIHDYTGGFLTGTGHMSWVLVSAFDPIFWLHHSNIDRLFAIWQTLHPLAWFKDRTEQLRDPGSYYIPRLFLPTPTTELHPFRVTPGGRFYTSDDIRNWYPLNYSYTELQPWLEKYKVDGKFDEGIYYDDVVAQVKKLYGPDIQTFLPPKPPPVIPTQELQHPDYIVDITYNRYELRKGAPYRMYVFLGPAENDEDPRTWPNSKRLVRTLYTFSNPKQDDSYCANCDRQMMSGVLSTGQIPLTNSLLAHIANKNLPLASLDRDPVRDYLKNNLRWAVTTVSSVLL
ncbi:hypothetical protein BDZ91DRAFT_668585 [Kalaharituber pfeilii]|nr:hypothetical protein BDZ91DRAFT_668585 [Kalaharituber pfeilii]